MINLKPITEDDILKMNDSRAQLEAGRVYRSLAEHGYTVKESETLLNNWAYIAFYLAVPNTPEEEAIMA